MLKFKSWKGKDKWLFLLTIGVILCILAFPVESLLPKTKEAGSGLNAAGDSTVAGIDSAAGKGEESTKDPAAGEAAAVPASASKIGDAYEKELEGRVRDILKNVDGVGEVDVMIVLKSSAEKVVHVDNSISRSTTEEKDTGGGTRKIDSEDSQASTVLTDGSGQNGTPIIEKELKPELSGIIISAAGGGSPTVRAEISAAMEALFDLPAHKIKVLKRVE